MMALMLAMISDVSVWIGCFRSGLWLACVLHLLLGLFVERRFKWTVIKMTSNLDEVIEAVMSDPDIDECGATIFYHTGVGRYVGFMDYRLKSDHVVKRILPARMR